MRTVYNNVYDVHLPFGWHDSYTRPLPVNRKKNKDRE